MNITLSLKRYVQHLNETTLSKRSNDTKKKNKKKKSNKSRSPPLFNLNLTNPMCPKSSKGHQRMYYYCKKQEEEESTTTLTTLYKPFIAS